MLAFVFLLGILWYERGEMLFLAAFVLVILYGDWNLIKKKMWGRLAIRSLIFAGTFWAAFLHMQERSQIREEYFRQISDGDFYTIQGEISKKQIKNDQYVYLLTNCYTVLSGKSQACGSGFACFSSDDYPIGKTLVIQGEISLFAEATNEGAFDSRSFYCSQGIYFCMYSCQVTGVYGNEDRIAERLYQIREGLADTLGQLLDAQEAGILSGMLLGDRSNMDSEIKAVYQNAGISHILAISGVKTLNLALPRGAKKPVNSAFLGIHRGKIYIKRRQFWQAKNPVCPFGEVKGDRLMYELFGKRKYNMA